MSHPQVENPKKPLRINENKIRTLEVSEVDDSDRSNEEHGVTPTKAVAVNASSGHRPSF